MLKRLNAFLDRCFLPPPARVLTFRLAIPVTLLLPVPRLLYATLAEGQPQPIAERQEHRAQIDHEQRTNRHRLYPRGAVRYAEPDAEERVEAMCQPE